MLREKTGDIITFVKFEEINVLTKNRNDAERSDKSDYGSIMPPLLSEEEIDAMDSSDDSDDDLISKDMLENTHD